jgi:hypothetical protein
LFSREQNAGTLFFEFYSSRVGENWEGFTFAQFMPLMTVLACFFVLLFIPIILVLYRRRRLADMVWIVPLFAAVISAVLFVVSRSTRSKAMRAARVDMVIVPSADNGNETDRVWGIDCSFMELAPAVNGSLGFERNESLLVHGEGYEQSIWDRTVKPEMMTFRMTGGRLSSFNTLQLVEMPRVSGRFELTGIDAAGQPQGRVSWDFPEDWKPWMGVFFWRGRPLAVRMEGKPSGEADLSPWQEVSGGGARLTEAEKGWIADVFSGPSEFGWIDNVFYHPPPADGLLWVWLDHIPGSENGLGILHAGDQPMDHWTANQSSILLDLGQGEGIPEGGKSEASLLFFWKDGEVPFFPTQRPYGTEEYEFEFWSAGVNFFRLQPAGEETLPQTAGAILRWDQAVIDEGCTVDLYQWKSGKWLRLTNEQAVLDPLSDYLSPGTNTLRFRLMTDSRDRMYSIDLHAVTLEEK